MCQQCKSEKQYGRTDAYGGNEVPVDGGKFFQQLFFVIASQKVGDGGGKLPTKTNQEQFDQCRQQQQKQQQQGADSDRSAQIPDPRADGTQQLRQGASDHGNQISGCKFDASHGERIAF